MDCAELNELVSSLEGCGPDQLTGSDPWSVHELTAHLAAGADELGTHLEAMLDGLPAAPTRQGDEREQPFRDLDDPELRRVFTDRQDRLVSVLDRALAKDPQAQLPFAGSDVPVWAILTHVRLEAAIHRWDLTGDDETNDRQLSAPDLTAHSVMALGPALLEKGLANARGEQMEARMRADDQMDVVVQAGGGNAVMVLQPPEDAAVWIEGDAAARLLLLWGRRPGRPGRLRGAVPHEQLARLFGLLQAF